MSPVPLPSAIAFSRNSKLVKRESILKTFQTSAHDAASVVIMLRINCRPLVTVKMTSIFFCTKLWRNAITRIVFHAMEYAAEGVVRNQYEAKNGLHFTNNTAILVITI